VIADIILIIAAALFIGVYVSWRAGRIDRLHARVDMARAALDATLLRRSSVALALATSGLLDPATSLLLANAVDGTRTAVLVPGGTTPPGTAPSLAGPPVPLNPPGPSNPLGPSSPPDPLSPLGPLGPHSGEAPRPRDLAESDLTRALRAAFSQPGFRSSLSGDEGADELLAEVEAASHQVFLARKFYNDLAAATREARRRPLARTLRLAGKAPAPEFFEMDDSLLAETSSRSPLAG
jgi:hypothetical protein